MPIEVSHGDNKSFTLGQLFDVFEQLPLSKGDAGSHVCHFVNLRYLFERDVCSAALRTCPFLSNYLSFEKLQ